MGRARFAFATFSAALLLGSMIGCSPDESGVVVPDVVNMKASLARAELKQAGFQVRVVLAAGSVLAHPARPVVTQNPSAGGTAEPGSTVVISVPATGNK